MSPRARCRQRGAALLAAMLTVTLVATFAATALWQQWRSVEVEAAERRRGASDPLFKLGHQHNRAAFCPE